MNQIKKYTLFIIENNEAYTFMLKYKLQRHPEYKIISLKSCEECIENVVFDPDIILVEYKLLISCSKEVLNIFKLYAQKISIIILSPQEEATPILNLMKEGTFEYISKEEDATKLVNKLILKIAAIISRKETTELKTKKQLVILTLVLLLTLILLICWAIY